MAYIPPLWGPPTRSNWRQKYKRLFHLLCVIKNAWRLHVFLQSNFQFTVFLSSPPSVLSMHSKVSHSVSSVQEKSHSVEVFATNKHYFIWQFTRHSMPMDRRLPRSPVLVCQPYLRTLLEAFKELKSGGNKFQFLWSPWSGWEGRLNWNSLHLMGVVRD